MGTQLSLPKKGTAPTQFSAHVYCGQTAGWIKVPLGTEVGIGPGVVLDGDAAPPTKKRHSLPVFSPCLLCPNGWMDEDATWYGSRPRSMTHCVRRGPSCAPPPPAQKGHSRSPSFLAHVYWPWSPISATAKLLLSHVSMAQVCRTQ